ncbi:MAG: hypothetical protein LBG13_01115 [Holosporales bacterium]|nr:hypothetical protein [Holosporales bacterium]
MNIGFKLGCYVAAMVLGGVIGNASATDNHESTTSNTVAIPEYIEGKDVSRFYVKENRIFGYQLRSTGELLNGLAKLKLGNGDVCEGNYENGIMNGRGKCTLRDGTVYEGNYENGMLNGAGTCTYEGGDRWIGQFKNGMIWDGWYMDKEKGRARRYYDSKFWEGTEGRGYCKEIVKRPIKN